MSRQAVLSYVPELLQVVRRALLETPPRVSARGLASAAAPKKEEEKIRPREKTRRLLAAAPARRLPPVKSSLLQKPTTSRRLARLDDNNLIATKTGSPKAHAGAANARAVKQEPFSAYQLHSGLHDALSARFGKSGTPSAIQALSLNHFATDEQSVLPDQAVLLAAETGSGKTLAYLLPLANHLKATDSGPPAASNLPQVLEPRSLVLSPTHELSRQLTDSAKLLSHTAKLRVVGLSSMSSGAVPRKGQVDICVATAGSLARAMGIAKQKNEEDAEDKRALSEDKRAPVLLPNIVEWIVVDEADVLLGRNFVDDTKSIIAHVESSRRSQGLPPPRLVLSTATLPPSLMTWLEEHHPDIMIIRSPSLHRLPAKLRAKFVPFSGSGNRLADVAHEVKRVLAEDARDRAGADTQVKSRDPWADRKAKIIIFCNTEGKVHMLNKVLEERALPSLAITSNNDSRTRGSNGLLDAFLLPAGGAEPESGAESKGPRILVTTSLLSRGLDFAPDVRHVFLLDTPRDTLDFIHRAGRSARAGRPGSVTVFGGRESLSPGIRQLLGQ